MSIVTLAVVVALCSTRKSRKKRSFLLLLSFYLSCNSVSFSLPQAATVTLWTRFGGCGANSCLYSTSTRKGNRNAGAAKSNFKRKFKKTKKNIYKNNRRAGNTFSLWLAWPKLQLPPLILQSLQLVVIIVEAVVVVLALAVAAGDDDGNGDGSAAIAFASFAKKQSVAQFANLLSRCQ